MARKRVTVRLILDIISTTLEETALVVIVLWGLPKIGIYIPLAGLIAMMAALLAYAIFSYRMGSRALRRKPVDGLPNMVGSKGKVMTSLAPEGFVKIKGELWQATSADRRIKSGEEITVIRQDRLKLVVCKYSSEGFREAE